MQLTITRANLATHLRKGDRIVAIDGRELSYVHTVASTPNGGPVDLVNPNGTEVVYRLYPDTHVAGEITVERKDRRPAAFQRRTRYGLTLYSRNGGWETLDGRFRIQREDAPTMCDAEHPVKLTAWMIEQVRERPYYYAQVEPEKWSAVMFNRRGYLCPGGADHTYPVWTVWIDGDSPADGIANSFDEAWHLLADLASK